MAIRETSLMYVAIDLQNLGQNLPDCCPKFPKPKPPSPPNCTNRKKKITPIITK